MHMFIKRLSPLLVSSWSAFVLFLVPFVAGAQTTTTAPVDFCKKGVNDFTDFMGYLIQCLIGGLITRVIIAMAVIAFMFGVLRYIWAAGQGNADYKKNLAQYLMWSIFAIFIMLSVWGIIYMIGASLGIGQGGVAPIPTLPTGP